LIRILIVVSFVMLYLLYYLKFHQKSQTLEMTFVFGCTNHG